MKRFAPCTAASATWRAVSTTEMNDPAQQSRLTDCRLAVRRYLCLRPTVAQDGATIAHGVNAKGHDFATAEVEMALHFWTQLTPPQMEIVRRSAADPAKHFRITSEGIMAFERGE